MGSGIRHGQKIIRMMNRGENTENNTVLAHMIVKKVVVDLSMLGVLMEDIIVSKLESTHIVTI